MANRFASFLQSLPSRPTPQMQPNNPFGQIPGEDDGYQMYNPVYDQQNMFNREIGNVPTPNNPSLLRKIGAVLAGAGGGGYETSQKIAYAPYYHQLALRSQKLPLLQQAADNERMINQQGLTANNQYRTSKFNERKLESSEKLNQDKLTFAREKEANDVRAENEKLELARWRAQNPNGVLKTGEDGFINVVNPQTGAVIRTGLKSNELSDLQKINLGLDADLKKIAAQGSNQIKLEETRSANDMEQIEARGDQTIRNLTFRKDNPTVSRSTTPSASQEKQAKINRMNDLKLAQPELGQFIKLDPNGYPEVEKPTTSLFGTKKGPTWDQYQRIVQFLNKVTPGSTGQNRKVTMIAPNGDEREVEASEVEYYKSKGAKVK